MPFFVYVGTPGQVGEQATGELLSAHPWHAIWCPPPGLRPWAVGVHPHHGDSCLVMWRQHAQEQPHPLGCGTILGAPRNLFLTTVLWTQRDLPGLRDVAQGLGYGGGAAMSFLRLGGVSSVGEVDVHGLPFHLPAGLTEIPHQAWIPGEPIACGC